MVIFLKLLVSGNAILNVATHMSHLFFLAFPSKVGRFEWLENCDCFLLDFTCTLVPAIELVSI